MPSPLVWTALIAAFLGFGVLMGKATGTGSVAALASKRGPVLLVAAAPDTKAESTAVTPPPAPEAQSTPEPSGGTESSTTQPSKEATGGSSPSSSSSGSKETSASKGGSSKKAGAKLPAIKHVFVVMLSDEPYATAFGPVSSASYLTGALEKQGELLVRYYGVAQEGLANGIALLSGQGPTEATAANCLAYTALTPAAGAANGQLSGNGCVYPTSTSTLMGQLQAKHLSWKAYVEGNGEAGTPACSHPALGVADPSSLQSATAGYRTWRNPFVYFKSVTGSSACTKNDLGIAGLAGDLAKGRAASFSYIAPGPCYDGNPTPCAPGRPAGMTAADGFLRRIVPKILSSTAYKQNGLLAITTDAAPTSGEYADSSSCCGQPRFPNLPAASGAAALSPPGGGQVGLLLLSPFVKKGGELVQDTYNHFSLLATIEQLFGLSKLGYAGLSEVKPLSPSLFSGG